MSHIRLPNIISHSASAAGTTVSQDINVGQGPGVIVYINITAITGTSPTLTVTLSGVSPQGVTHTILASAALTAAGQTVLKVYPGLVAVANLSANDILPATWRLTSVIGGTTPAVTATISAVVLD